MQRVFVLGAGASRGSQGNITGPVSPLIDELFADQYHRYGREIGLSTADLTFFRNESGASVEKWLTARWSEIEQMGSELRKNPEKKNCLT